MGHPTGLGRLSRTYLLALARAAPDWELHIYFRHPGQLEDLAGEYPRNSGFDLETQIKEITKDSDGRFKGHYRVGLDILCAQHQALAN